MPYLKDVPNIHNYRISRNFNQKLLDEEIINKGGLLSSRQILCRGGAFKAEDMAIQDKPISTTTMPSVAVCHANKASTKTVALLSIAENFKIRAYIFKTKGNQRHTREYEVLLQNNLKLTYKESVQYGNMNILKYDVYAI